uniref:Uncharacterized protein n=2 Tax=Guillardia theta TaxID=55529 RepID=A0A7S4KZJ0_GUITH|mmetsp:Transcript_3449/g.11916  ORF Transcript_3449/g.11916 Transcript_3449/m.11916 type:complete len:471 (+) Transcript_3449:94-1506(+)
MSRPGTKGSNPSGKVMNADDGIQEVVPLSLQKLRELADSLRSSMPEENNVGSPSPSRVGRKGRSRQDRSRKRQVAMDQGMQSQLGAMEVESLQAMVKQTEAKLQELSVEHDRMIAEGKEQQQAFIRREVQYQSQIKRMKELLEKAISSRGNENNGMPRLREMHEKIMQKLAEKQDATKTLMMKQEKEMLKIFRSKLFEVEDKLKKTGGKKNNEAVGGIPRSWLERATKLARELEHYKEESIRLDAENERLTKESTRLQAEYHSHEDDVRYLESQLVALKKENLKLKKDREDAATVSMRAFLATDHSKRQRSQEEERPPAEDGSKPQESKQMEEEAYAQIEKVKVSISRMRKLIEDERARLREVRTAHVKELASRTELESDHASPPLFSFLTFSSPPQVSFVTVLPMSRSRSQDTRWSPWTKSHRRSTTPLAPCMRRRTRKRSGTGFWSCSCPRRGLSPFCLRRPFLIKHQ